MSAATGFALVSGSTATGPYFVKNPPITGLKWVSDRVTRTANAWVPTVS
ncbi:hypothetical protein GCM10019059_44850 [Camelimonas fluminis]|nr:hypothetical protein GCM10019059_44850 [Camelimonas fluminis]